MRPESEPRISRRDVLKYMGGGLVGGSAASAVATLKIDEYIDERRGRPAYYDINKYRFGYPSILSDRQERLFSSLQSERVAIDAELSPGKEIKGSISAVSEHPHILVFTGVPNEALAMNILELEIDDKNIIVPVIQSENFAQACIYLGGVKPDTEFKVKQLNAGFPNKSDVNPLQMDAFSISADPFTTAVIKNIPELFVREDNKEDDNISNDIPLSSDIRIRESWNGVRMIEYLVDFSGEDGGSAPYPLIETEGRLTDKEVIAFAKVTDLGMTLEEAYQGVSHSVHVAKQYYQDPKTIENSQRLKLVIETDNNMVKQGDGTKRSFSHFPDFLQEHLELLNWAKRAERERAMRAISIRESLRQGYLRKDDKYVQWFIQNELNGVDLIFPFISKVDVS